MGMEIITLTLSGYYRDLGRLVARRPFPFLIGPPIISLLLLSGLARFYLTSDPEYLYAPINGRGQDDRDYFEDTFPSNTNGFYVTYSNVDLFDGVNVLLEDKRSRNILNLEAADAIIKLHEFILTISERDDGVTYTYKDICSNFLGNCSISEILIILANRPDGNYTDISYPFHEEPGFGTFNLVNQVGGVVVKDGLIQSARTIQLGYSARNDYKDDRTKADKWYNEVRDEMDDYKDRRIEVDYMTSLTIDQELVRAFVDTLPLFFIASLCLHVFAINSTAMHDHVRTKNIVAIGGMFAATLATISAVGLGSMLGFKLATVVGNMPFLILGIGLDNMFIMVSAWRYTSYKKSVEDRMGETMENSAVSVTITTATDALAFAIGTATPFRSITIFCVYAGLAVIFAFIYMLTFVSACMVYAGRLEASNRNPIYCVKVLPKEHAKAEGKSKAYILLCAGGSIEQHEEPTAHVSTIQVPKNPDSQIAKNAEKNVNNENGGSDLEMSQSAVSNSTHAQTTAQNDENDGILLPFLNKFLGTTFALFLMRKPVKIGVIATYLTLLSLAIYGITIVEEGLERKLLVPSDSYYRDYQDKYERDFFKTYGPMVMIGVDEPVDYTTAYGRMKIRELIRDFKSDSRVLKGEEFTISWLDTYENFLIASDIDINNLTMPEFINILRNDFLPDPLYIRFTLDITFNAEYTEIPAARFYVQSKSVKEQNDAEKLLIDSRDTADDAKLDVEVFAPDYVYVDAYPMILPVTLQNLGLAIGSMMIIAFIMIPSLATVFWVTLSVLSIIVCVFGFMSLWGISLDTVSMILLVMSIGFSVDFAAHISYHFVASKSDDPIEKVKDALGYLGTPIFQGAGSTILGVLALAGSKSYIYTSFFKVVFLVQAFGFFHAIFLLPVVLTTFDFSFCAKKWKKMRGGREFSTESTGQTNKAFENVI